MPILSFIVDRYIQKISNAEPTIPEVFLLCPVALPMHYHISQLLLDVLLLSLFIKVDAVELEDLFGADRWQISP